MKRRSRVRVRVSSALASRCSSCSTLLSICHQKRSPLERSGRIWSGVGLGLGIGRGGVRVRVRVGGRGRVRVRVTGRIRGRQHRARQGVEHGQGHVGRRVGELDPPHHLVRVRVRARARVGVRVRVRVRVRVSDRSHHRGSGRARRRGGGGIQQLLGVALAA